MLNEVLCVRLFLNVYASVFSNNGQPGGEGLTDSLVQHRTTHLSATKLGLLHVKRSIMCLTLLERLCQRVFQQV
jgi:hypothetical protein